MCFESFWRLCLASLVTAGLGMSLSLAPARSADVDPSKMSAEEIKAVKQRLTDAGCYKGAIDAMASRALDIAIKACPDPRPFLRIETGMHTAVIRGMSVDAACSLLATASEDKTVRLWSLPDGKLKRVVRLPIGDGNAGKLFATALSPDGRWLAAGGWDAAYDKTGKYSLTMLDLSNGAIRRFGEFQHVISKIVFSADGRRIALGFAAVHGVRVLDSSSGAELLADPENGAPVYGLAFGSDGSLVTSSWDDELRRYGPDLKLMVKRAAPDGKKPYGVAIDPSGRRVAVGYVRERPVVSILDARTLVPVAKTQTNDNGYGDFGAVAWSSDGATLIAASGTRFVGGEWRNFLRQYDASGERKGTDIDASADTIQDIYPCGNGFVFTAGDPGFGLLSAQGVAITLQGPRAADMRGKLGSALAVSGDATVLRFGLGYGEHKPVVFDLASASLADSPTLPSRLAQARVDGLPVTDWRDNYYPKFRGENFGFDGFDLSHALAIRPDASGFVFGTQLSVRTYDANGEQRWHQDAGPGVAWGVDFSANGEIVVVAYGDGTTRWLRWSDGQELLAFFVEPQSRKWVVWTPSGYYMASEGGEDLIGRHVNRGWNQEADFFPGSQLRAQYNRPDIVRLVLKTWDEAEAVRRANAALKKPDKAKPDDLHPSQCDSRTPACHRDK